LLCPGPYVLKEKATEGELIFDPMAGGGVVPDTCLAFNRRCWSFDLADRPETRPEIEPHQWNPERLVWPVKGKERADLIFFSDTAPGLRFEVPSCPAQRCKEFFE